MTTHNTRNEVAWWTAITLSMLAFFPLGIILLVIYYSTGRNIPGDDAIRTALEHKAGGYIYRNTHNYQAPRHYQNNYPYHYGDQGQQGRKS